MQVKLDARVTVCTWVHLAYQDPPPLQTSFGWIGRLCSRGFQSGFAKKTTFRAHNSAFSDKKSFSLLKLKISKAHNINIFLPTHLFQVDKIDTVFEIHL